MPERSPLTVWTAAASAVTETVSFTAPSWSERAPAERRSPAVKTRPVCSKGRKPDLVTLVSLREKLPLTLVALGRHKEAAEAYDRLRAALSEKSGIVEHPWVTTSIAAKME